MDVYTPAGDSDTKRAVVMYFHTGIFLPPLLNGGITGARSDSSVVEFARRLTRLGYVVVVPTYRLGWNPVAPNQNVRTGTLLNAAYRGIQDARSCIRFLRKSIAENSNPYGIDADKWYCGARELVVTSHWVRLIWTASRKKSKSPNSLTRII
ncbi:MAG: hypothetical protein IPO07_22535 [Haliscomenobacter sp.]|nr:hypothetical protein [Haliscomenobacter sp.]MBK9491252.1 hypothetical protein [Haliscomenobacter sp.]